MSEDVTRSYSQYIREENLQAIKEMIADESETEDIIRDSIRVEGEVSEQYFVEEISKIVSQQYIMVNLAHLAGSQSSTYREAWSSPPSSSCSSLTRMTTNKRGDNM